MEEKISKDLNILSGDYKRIVIETEDKKEILAEITNEDIKTANNIIVRLKP